MPESFSQGSAAVVIDILRATSTMAMAFSLGAGSIRLFARRTLLMECHRSQPGSVMLGERDGRTIPGFHFGNSPLELTSEAVSGKQILMTTTNGARAAESVSHAPVVLTAAFVNRHVIAEFLAIRQPEQVYLVCSGWKGGYSAEDAAGAGALIHALEKITDHDVSIENDEALAAMALFNTWQSDLNGLLRRCSHGKRLIRLGADNDLRWCSKLDCIEIVPLQTSPGCFSPVVIS